MSLLKRSIALILLFICFAGQHTYGQFVVTKVKDRNVNTASNGFFYSLPQTVFRISIVYEEVQKIRGPFADYAKEYLGTSDYISTTANEYNILNVDVFPEVEADPGQFYYISYTAEKTKDEKPAPAFHFTPFGTLLAVDDIKEGLPLPMPVNVDQTFIIGEGEQGFTYEADYHRKKKIDTVIRRITIDTVNIEQFLFKTSWVDKTPEDRADEAAKQITAIREARFNLLSGYQEVNYGESMSYMDGKLKELENSYLELFLGKKKKTVVSKTIYYTPSKGKVNESLLEMPDGSMVNIRVVPHELTDKLPPQPLEKPGSIYYRIPDEATVEVEYEDEVFFRKNFLINQLGIITTVPVSQTRLRFDPLTGTLTKFVRE
ncbi:MAG: DUF4831 family protein [Chlorobi bacterium]|nr:DUF4831 family protein [Chlorobiota bacterium]